MPKSEYTNGPWSYFIGNANGQGLIRIESSIGASVSGVHVASMARGKQGEANARLIAAAPTMADYITKRAEAGDADAIEILGVINGNS